MPDQKHIVVAGAGTAGLTTSLIIKKMFPKYDVTVAFSDDIGIIGVGEGSTEHWRWFQDFVGISPDDMVRHADISHKYGIRFENWNTKNPSYFHSIAGSPLSVGTFLATYSYLLENDLLLTNALSWKGLEEDKVLDVKDEDGNDQTHFGTNQYHFDTHKLNVFLKKVASDMGINFVEGKITKVNLSNNGHISSIELDNFSSPIAGDLFVDCTGFSRVLISNMRNIEFNSFDKYLPCDSALVFQTDLDESGKIHPFTRAIAMNAGWMWEIPTQSRKGNGYVFSSKYISEEEALKEAEEFHGIEIDDYRVLSFKPGYYSAPWQNNCVSIGLSYSFIEPLEATTISIGIQQAKLLCSFLANYSHESKYMQEEYNRIMKDVMENAVSMISLHYMSDREDTQMWKDQKTAQKPDLLKRLLQIWSERLPEYQDVPSNHFELFGTGHLWHVAQGQGILNKDLATTALNAYGSRPVVTKNISDNMTGLLKVGLIDHAESLRRTKNS